MTVNLTITNPEILDFITRYPHISLEEIISLGFSVYQHALNLVSEDKGQILSHLLSFKNQINGDLQSFRQDQNSELNKLVQNLSGEIKKEFKNEDNFNSLEKKLSTEIQNGVKAALKENLQGGKIWEDLVQNQMVHLKEELKLANFQTKEIKDLIHQTKQKTGISSVKGNLGEKKLLDILTEKLTTSEIIYTATKAHCGDIIIKKEGLPDILIDTKDYSANVGKDEIQKFHRDITLQNCCGILVSQKTGIANRENFQIEIIDGQVCVYLHQTDYQFSPLKTAIDIIYSLYNKIHQEKSGIHLDEEYLDRLSTEYRAFLTKQGHLIKKCKDHYKEILENIESMRLPHLELLSQPQPKENLKGYCDVCYKIFTPTGLKLHRKTHGL